MIKRAVNQLAFIFGMISMKMGMSLLGMKVVSLYTSGNDDVTAMHFAASEEALNGSIKAYYEDYELWK